MITDYVQNKPVITSKKPRRRGGFVAFITRVPKVKLVLSGFVLIAVLVGLVGLWASTQVVKETQDQRSQASESNAVTEASIYFPATFQRVTNTESIDLSVKVTLQRPVTGISFSVSYDSSKLDVRDFVVNPAFASAFAVAKEVDPAHNRANFIIFQPTGDDNQVLLAGEIGFLKVQPLQSFVAQSGTSPINFMPQRTVGSHLPNQASVKDGIAEVISLNPGQGFVVMAGAPYSNATIAQVSLSKRMNQVDPWEAIGGDTVEFTSGMLVRMVVNKNVLPNGASLPQGTQVLPSFAVKVVAPGGSVRGTLVRDGRQGGNADNLIQDLSIIDSGSQRKLILLDDSNQPIMDNQVTFRSGDSLDIAVNMKFIENNLVISCLTNSQVVANAVGDPTHQIDLNAACVNESRKYVTWGAPVPPTPTAVPGQPTNTPTPTPTLMPLLQQTVPALKVTQRGASGGTWQEISAPQFAFVDGTNLRVVLNRTNLLPAFSSLPAGVTQAPSYRLRVVTSAGTTRGTVYRDGWLGDSGNYVQDYKVTTVSGSTVIQVINNQGQPVSGQQVPFLAGDTLNVDINMKLIQGQTVYGCQYNGNAITYPLGSPSDLTVYGTCFNSSLKQVTWQ